ncbi:MAG: type II toxin-antitoxin system VapC family toxin [Pirellulales bacterium]
MSKFAPERSAPPDTLAIWMHEKGEIDELFLSVMTVAEIRRGIRGLERRGAKAKAASLQRWFDGLLSIFADRILDMDTAIALAAGEIEDHALGAGHDPGLADVIIAATARVHDLVVVTENTRHFQPLGIPVQAPVTA